MFTKCQITDRISNKEGGGIGHKMKHNYSRLDVMSKFYSHCAKYRGCYQFILLVCCMSWHFLSLVIGQLSRPGWLLFTVQVYRGWCTSVQLGQEKCIIFCYKQAMEFLSFSHGPHKKEDDMGNMLQFSLASGVASDNMARMSECKV
jgi:hypothetical protein